MRIAGIQMAASRERAENWERAERLVREAAAAGAELIALQEYFATGAFTEQIDADSFDLAEPDDGETVRYMARLARELAVWMVVPLFEAEAARNGRYYNAAMVLDREGRLVGKYRKLMVPLSGSKEKYYFTPGNLGTPVFQADDLRFGISICYDRHFPEIQRLLALKGAEVVILPSCIRKRPGRTNTWGAEATAMACHNGIYVLAINSTGDRDGKAQFGNTMLVDPLGQVVQKLDEEEGFVGGEIDRAAIHQARAAYPHLRDLRRDLLEELLQRI